MNINPSSAETFVKTWLEKRGWDALVEDAKHFVEDSSIDKLSPNQLNRLRRLFHDATSLEVITEFIDYQKERDEKRGGEKWAKIAADLKTEVESIPHRRGQLKAELVEFADVHLFYPEGEIEAYLDSEDQETVKSFNLYLAGKFFTAVYTICRCKHEKIEIPIEGD
jgi:hypothetical protein